MSRNKSSEKGIIRDIQDAVDPLKNNRRRQLKYLPWKLIHLARNLNRVKVVNYNMHTRRNVSYFLTDKSLLLSLRVSSLFNVIFD